MGPGRKTCLSKNLVRGAKGNTRVSYALQGLVTCASCGRLLAARTRREKNGRTFCDTTDVEVTAANVGRVPISRPTCWRRKFGGTSRTCFVPLTRSWSVSATPLATRWRRISGQPSATSKKWTAALPEADRDLCSRDHLAGRISSTSADSSWSHWRAAEERVGRLTAQKERADAATGAGNDFIANVSKYLATLGVQPSPPEDGGPLDAEGLKSIIRDIFARAIIGRDNRLRYELRVPTSPPQPITSTPSAWT